MIFLFLETKLISHFCINRIMINVSTMTWFSDQRCQELINVHMFSRIDNRHNYVNVIL